MKKNAHFANAVRFLMLATAFSGVAAYAQDVLVIANREISVSQLTAQQLRDIFTGTRSRFPDGTRAWPILLKGGAVHEVFVTKDLGQNTEGFRRGWKKAQFTGQGIMPKEFSSELEVVKYVAATRGAVGYVSHLLDDQAVKVLTVLP